MSSYIIILSHIATGAVKTDREIKFILPKPMIVQGMTYKLYMTYKVWTFSASPTPKYHAHNLPAFSLEIRNFDTNRQLRQISFRYCEKGVMLKRRLQTMQTTQTVQTGKMFFFWLYLLFFSLFYLGSLKECLAVRNSRRICWVCQLGEFQTMRRRRRNFCNSFLKFTCRCTFPLFQPQLF